MITDETGVLQDDEFVEEQSETLTIDHNLGQAAGVVHGGMHTTVIYQQIRHFGDYHELGSAYLERVRRGFVERRYRTAGSGEVGSAGAAELFEAYRCLVIIGRSGAGRHTAALGVLSHLGIPLRELPGWDPAQPGHLSLTDLPCEPKLGYLMELPETISQVGDLARQLESHRETLRTVGSYLVVVATEEIWTALGGYWDNSVLVVGRPDPLELLQREVALLDEDRDLSALVNNPAIRALIADAAPRDITRLGHLIVTAAASTAGDGQTDFPAVLNAVTAAYRNWDTELATWFQRHRDVRERLFLVSTAMLEGSRADLVLRCAQELGQRLDSVEPRHGIEGPGVRELAEYIDARVGPDGHLRFLRPEYAAAVLDFVRADRSDVFRRCLWHWAADLPLGFGSCNAAVRLADRVAVSLLAWVMRHRDPSILRLVVQTWAGRTSLRPIAVDVLTAAALSPEVGPLVRAHLNQWAARAGDANLLCAVAETCQGPLADSYPKVALTRLNHLAARPAEAVRDATVAAMSCLWTRSALRPLVLVQITSWLADPDDPAFVVGCRVLATLSLTDDPTSTPVSVAHDSDPSAILDHHLGVAMGVALGAEEPPVEVRETIMSWLTLATRDPAFADLVIDLLVTAVRGKATARRIARVNAIARHWCLTSQDDTSADHRFLLDRVVDHLGQADPMIGESPTVSLRTWSIAP